MKHGMMAAIAALMLLGSVPARADEGKDWAMEVGSKLWVQKWDTKQNAGAGAYTLNAVNLPQYSNHASANHKTATSGVPYFFLKYKDLFMSGSWSGSTVFDFPATREVIANVNGAAAPNRAFEMTSKVKATRFESDINLGYMVFPQVGVTMGYKGVQLNYDEYLTGNLVGDLTTVLVPRNFRTTFKYDGFVVGIAAGADLGKGFQIYGLGGGGFMNAKMIDRTGGLKDRTNWGTASYEVAELGFKWANPDWHLKAQVGYKYQGINASIAGKDLTTGGTLNKISTQDVTSGYVMGLGVTF